MPTLAADLWSVLSAAGGSLALTFIVALSLGIAATTVLFLGSAVVVLERFARATRRMRSVVIVTIFWAGLLAAWSQLLAPRVAARIGLIRTMSFTHLPANGFLIAAAFMPNAALAVGCLLARAALSQMDVPARSSYVMAMVSPAERPAAASITSVPRSLVAAVPPAIAGWLLTLTTFGWPLIIGGAIKATYDLLLLQQFRHHRPPEEQTS